MFLRWRPPGGMAAWSLAFPPDLSIWRRRRVDHVADSVGFRAAFDIPGAHAAIDLFARHTLGPQLGDVVVAVKAGDGCLNGLLLMAEVRKTVSPQTIGDDHPRPGDVDLPAHVLAHRPPVGNEAAGAMPLSAWPRKPGQVSSGRGGAALRTEARPSERMRESREDDIVDEASTSGPARVRAGTAGVSNRGSAGGCVVRLDGKQWT